MSLNLVCGNAVSTSQVFTIWFGAAPVTFILSNPLITSFLLDLVGLLTVVILKLLMWFIPTLNLSANPFGLLGTAAQRLQVTKDWGGSNAVVAMALLTAQIGFSTNMYIYIVHTHIRKINRYKYIGEEMHELTNVYLYTTHMYNMIEIDWQSCVEKMGRCVLGRFFNGFPAAFLHSPCCRKKL